MAKFSEEEVVTLKNLVTLEIYSAECSHIVQEAPEYLPFLLQLEEKLLNYYTKHYHEEA